MNAVGQLPVGMRECESAAEIIRAILYNVRGRFSPEDLRQLLHDEAGKTYGMFAKFFIPKDLKTNYTFDEVMRALRHASQVLERPNGMLEVTPILNGESGEIAFNRFSPVQRSRFVFLANELKQKQAVLA